MDEKKLAILKADIASQMSLITQVFATLERRVEGLTPDNLEKLESVAYQLHNLYNAVEDLLKIVATHCENQISDSAKWHSLLLQRMTQEIQGVRPALLSQESYFLLNVLRGFRHFFRHAYGISIDYAQLQSNLDKAKALKEFLNQDTTSFLNKLEN